MRQLSSFSKGNRIFAEIFNVLNMDKKKLNRTQPTLPMLDRIADVLGCEKRELITE